MRRHLCHPGMGLLMVLVVVVAACSSGGDDGGAAPTSVSEPSADVSEPDTATPPPTPAPTPTPTPTPTTERSESSAPNPPTRNPFLADSDYAVGHADSGQQDTSPLAGPTGPTEVLAPEDLSYAPIGPAHFGIAVSAAYPDGERVIWSNGGDRIVKLDHDTFEVLAELAIPGKVPITEAEADEALARLDELAGTDEGSAFAAELAATHLLGLAGVYYALDVDNTLFVGGADSVIAYVDDPSDRRSPITVGDTWIKPAEITGDFVGVNMTFDGRLVLATEHGWVVVLERDFSSYEAILLAGSEDAVAFTDAQEAAGRRGMGWVRNSMAVDEDDGIYVPSLDQMHKVVWTGDRLSVDAAAGAWSEPFLNGTDNGTGATPSLMGFDDEDRFVVITDGQELMNVVLYWRDEVPAGWEPPPGAPSTRIAGMLPATMGDPDRTAIQTEQSVVVSGYGALVVNNEPATIPEGTAGARVRLLVSYLGNDPRFTPSGVQKFSWDAATQELRDAWVTTEVSSPNAVPFVSIASDIVYTVGVREGLWTVEGLDWSTGDAAFHYVMGASRYNSLFSGVALDQDGRIVYGTPFGKVRVER